MNGELKVTSFFIFFLLLRWGAPSFAFFFFTFFGCVYGGIQALSFSFYCCSLQKGGEIEAPNSFKKFQFLLLESKHDQKINCWTFLPSFFILTLLREEGASSFSCFNVLLLMLVRAKEFAPSSAPFFCCCYLQRGGELQAFSFFFFLCCCFLTLFFLIPFFFPFHIWLFYWLQGVPHGFYLVVFIACRWSKLPI